MRLLMVDDDPRDAELLREALEAVGADVEFHEVHDGKACLQFLKRVGPFNHQDPPDLIVLDLKMPGIDGKELLRRIKHDPGLEQLPVLVFTSSDRYQDIQDCYKLHASCYVVKPEDFTTMMEVARRITGFWFEAVRYPSMARA